MSGHELIFLLWILALAVAAHAALHSRKVADRSRTFQRLTDAQHYAARMDAAGYDCFIHYQVRCYRRKKDIAA
ncbi:MULTISPECIES: hypothetical protein [Xanthomonas]|uniref:hypothetical protein n=1 Tax=Xanthomonas TaxID=338 RepID=UPI000D68C58B|nr:MULTISPECIES: hypothetical protein [Xanthomonas]PWH21663.1 hypothetical protein CDO09_20140 [Xanthomonas perforans]QXF03568.1 hypothetical protein KJA71_08970 [Xanthomonas citri pv. citri]QXO96820.1 hypothetical protein IG630_24020 [Xanthomonas sp. WG16]